jgi:hypothetical protein
MAAVAHNPAFAKKVGIPQSVGQDFSAADKGRKFGKGGNVMSMVKKVAGYFAKKGEKKLAAHERREAAGKEEDTKAIAKKEEKVLKGAPKAMKDYEKKEHKDMGFKKGGMPKSKMPRRPMAVPPMGGPMAAGLGGMGGMGGMGAGAPPMGMKKGGMAGKQLSRTNNENKGGQSNIGGGVESKGRTKTKIVSSGRGMGIAQSGTRGAKETMGTKKYARGGGIESKGKTRGRFC